MKRWKYLLGTAVVLCLVVALMTIPAFGAQIVESGSCGEGVTYTLDADGVLTISGSGPMDDHVDRTPRYFSPDPDNDKDYSPWYDYRGRITTLVVKQGVTHIGAWAFYDCDSLRSVTLPESLDSIGDNAFGDCRILDEVVLPDGLTSIGDSAFYGCISLTSVALPESLDSIGDDAFGSCEELTGVVFPDGLTSIGDSAFDYCINLTSIDIPKSVTAIGSGPFARCSSLRGIWVDPQNSNYTSDEQGILFDKRMATLIQAHPGITGVYTAPDGLTSIGDYAFSYCSSLTSVTLPEGLTSIGDGAFTFCDGLTSIDIPESVTAIGPGPFARCSSLRGIWVDPQNSNYTSDEQGILFDKRLATLIQAHPGITGAYTAHDGLTSIGAYAFYYCDGLTSVTLPEGLTSIGERAFSNTGLTSVTLPEGLTSIGEYAFYYCKGLTSVTLPDSLTSIENCVFLWSGLTSVTLPEGLISIGDRAFSDTGLTSVMLPEGLTSIGDYAFGWTNLTSVTLPEGLTRIGKYAFFYCDEMTSVIFPEGLISIGDRAFSNCLSLTRVTLSEGLVSIGDRAFSGCISLTGIDIPKSVTTIGGEAFASCDSLKGIWVDPQNNSFVSDDRGGLFDKAMTTLIKVPGGITGAYTVPVGVTSIEDDAFEDCESLTSVTLPQGVTSIGDNMFSYLDSLTSVTLPKGLTSIGSWAFASCDVLESITFRGAAPEISSDAFSWVTVTAYYPAGDPTWTADVRQNYGGTITWVPRIVLDDPEIEFCYSQKQDSVRIQWTRVEGASGYQIYRSESLDGSTGWSCVKTIKDGTQNTYTNQGLTEGVTYYYMVRAYVDSDSGRVYSDFSEVEFMPAAVVWDGPYSNSSFRVRLRWNAVGSAHGYQIWRRDEGGEYRVVKTIGDRGNVLTNDQGDVTAYSNVGLASGGKYTYRMRAFYITPDGGKIYGPYSDEVSVAVQPELPTLSVVSTKTGNAKVSWELSGEADGYQIWMSESTGTGYKIVKSVYDGDVTSYTKTGLESGKTYYFKVRAYAEVDGKKSFGAYSEVISIQVK